MKQTGAKKKNLFRKEAFLLLPQNILPDPEKITIYIAKKRKRRQKGN